MPIPLGTVAAEGKNISNSKIITVFNTASFQYFGNYLITQVENTVGNSLCASGYTTGNTATKVFLAKFNEYGSFVWGKQLRVTRAVSPAPQAQIQSLVSDSSGNIYAGGTYNGNFVSQTVPFLAKFDFDGNLLWQKKIYRPNSEYQNVNGLTIMPNGTVLLTLSAYFSSSDAASYLINLTSDGVLISEKKTSVNANAYFDATNNIYVVEGYNLSGYHFVEKYNTNFQLISAKKSGTSAVYWSFENIDASGNYYAVANPGGTAGGTTFIKFNSSGTRLWAKRLVDAAGNPINPSTRDIKIDASGSIYFNVSIGNTARYFKSDNNGLLTYARTMVDGSGTGNATGEMSEINATKNNFNLCTSYDAYVLRTNGTTLGNYSITTSAGNRSYVFSDSTDTFTDSIFDWTMTDYTPVGGIVTSSQIAVDNLSEYPWETWADYVTGTTSIN